MVIAKHMADLVVNQILTVDVSGARKDLWRLGPVVRVDVHARRGCARVCDAQTTECRKTLRDCACRYLVYDKVNAHARLTNMNKHKPFIFPSSSIGECPINEPKLGIREAVRCVAQAHLSLYVIVFLSFTVPRAEAMAQHPLRMHAPYPSSGLAPR